MYIVHCELLVIYTMQAVLDSKEGVLEEPEQVYEYDYNSMKSGPEMVNVTTENMLELSYPIPSHL